MSAYDAEARNLRAPLEPGAPLMEAARYATLAANSHNSQPWRFDLGDNRTIIAPDLDRRLPAVDPDDHHLFASLGCAAENFLLAARALGRTADMTFDGEGEGRVNIDLGGDGNAGTELFGAIPGRQCTRSNYDGRAVSAEHLRRLEDAARVDGVELILVTDEAGRARTTEYVVEGNSVQMDDPAFRKELEAWIRFNPAAALLTRDGLFSGCTGNPSMPGWLARSIFPFVFTKDGENDKYVQQINSSAGIAVFVSDADDKRHWVDAGRSYQRFALQATALGIRHAHINQAVEVPAVRTDFAKWLQIGGRRPDIVVRFGYAPPLPMSLRRPVETVLSAGPGIHRSHRSTA
jgi:hypothetical protein